MSDKFKYNAIGFESKWQAEWERMDLNKAKDFSDKKKYYLLIEFPYPSGAGLHVGHTRSWSAMDAFARKKRMQGYNVLYPIGWDAFGLPAENYAIKTGIHPSITIKESIATFKRQIKSLGLSFDWSREVNTSDPEYYKWTQWIFLQLFKKGLAYQKEVAVNWCPTCKTNLADEEVMADGRHERCGNATEKRLQKQWLLAITKYADKLIEGLKEVDFSKEIATQQINWIGKSEGAEISFKIKGSNESLPVFTTRPDTLFGATFLVISPESIWVDNLTTQAQLKTVTEYIKETQGKDKLNLEREKTGIATGSYAINPATGKEIPIYVADYVLGSYGSGAIMAVPAHDGRDWDMAKKFNLPIIEVIEGGDIEKEAYTGEGKLINSGDWNGISVPESIDKIYSDIEAKGWGKKAAGYHLHDWVFSRQHYWGEPIPIIHCPKDGAVPVPEEDLPVELPYLEKYQPSGTGESPLANVSEWVKVQCPVCGGEAKRETDTMPNWAGSNWYFIRYLDAHNDKEMASKDKMKYWLPIDMYQGGYEHITLHLLYSRFIYKFLHDINVVPTSEPYAKRRSHGIVLASDGKKMSKSFGNVVNPDDIVGKYGADTLRLYEMFMGPFDQTIAWSEESLEGCYRFLGRIWRLFNTNLTDKTDPKLYIKLNQTINKVSNDIENLKFNTAVATLMEFSNAWNEAKSLSNEDAASLLKVMAPLVPHVAEEIWVNVLKEPFSIHTQGWPEADKEAIKSDRKIMVVQVNGKVRASLSLEADLAQNQNEVEELAKKDEKVSKWLGEGKVKKVIFVSGKLINFVI